jgi:hypothetical protein
MYNVPPYLIYMESYLHYVDKKPTEILGEIRDIYIYFLDKRFLNTSNIEDLQVGFPYCKIKSQDEYYYKVYSSYPLNKKNIFYRLIENSIILSIEDFYNIFLKGG